jgi:hypothetical protein
LKFLVIKLGESRTFLEAATERLVLTNCDTPENGPIGLGFENVTAKLVILSIITSP